MKIVRFIGGLGNQMFQCALLLALKERFHDESILADVSYFKTYSLHNGLEIERVFGLKLDKAAFYDILKFTWPVYNFKLSRAIEIFFPHRATECFENSNWDFAQEVRSAGGKYFAGYWQNEWYFREFSETIRRYYAFPEFETEQNRLLAEKLRLGNYVSVHVRRGDYLNHKLYKNTCGTTYYNKAISYMKNMVDIDGFVVFSNDINWCRNNLSIADDCIFVDWNKGLESYRDMQLMTLCKHNIIANSSFSWWGAWLNEHPQKKVIAPQVWINANKTNLPPCEDWLKL